MNSQQKAAQCFEARTESGRPLKLVMQELSLTGHILPVGARIIVRHVFCSSESKPVEAVYAFGLPRDAALRQFRIDGPDFTVHSELREVEQAVKIYESGIEEGRLSVLAQQYGDGLVNLSIGNLRPEEKVSVFLEVLTGVESQDDVYRFRFPFSLAPAYHADARIAEVEQDVGEIELPEDRFGDLLLPKFRKSGEGLHQIGFQLTVNRPSSNAAVGSPSHALRVQPEGSNMVRVTNGRDGDIPNRDLILEVQHANRKPIVFTGLDGQNQGQLAAQIPSCCLGTPLEKPISVVMLLDRSGSMEGPPIQQARKAVEACLAALSPDDLFGIVTFDNIARKFMPGLLPANRKNRERARAFLEEYRAGGGTELLEGLRSASSLFDKPGGDLLVVTDGQVFETEPILQAARKMGHRLHVLGIGSASQDRFLSLLARETGGTSRFLTARERVDLGALDLFSSIGNPVAESISLRSTGPLEASMVPEPPSQAFADSPLLLWGVTDGHGTGQLELSWKHPQPGSITLPFEIPKVTEELAETLRQLRGARLLTDLDSRLLPGYGAESRRQERRIEQRIQKLSEEFQLASRRMSLVAVARREGDQPGRLPATRVVPVGLPEDVGFGSYFRDFPQEKGILSSLGMAPVAEADFLMACSSPHTRSKSLRLRSFFSADPQPAKKQEFLPVPGDPLVELASLIEPDGGMPGNSLTERALRTILALMCFRAAERILQGGIFKRHAKRMVAFMRGLDRDRISEIHRDQIELGLLIVEDANFDWEEWQHVVEQLTGDQRLKEKHLEQMLSSVVASHAMSRGGA